MTSGPAEGAASPYPERVGRYELLLPIGTGGMATVHLARTPVVGDLHREVALKLMHAYLRAEDGEWSTHLLEEAKLAARIRHPNVVAVLEVGEGPMGVFLVMEYVEGDTLSGLSRLMRHKEQALPLPIAGRILVDSLAGLHAAHELNDEEGQPLRLVHRDFSPQNILVGVDGVSRLTDFGIAKSAARVGVTSSGIIKGKVGYMSPEQALGKQLDRRCDVWAAGVVAWELIAGRRLYKQEDQVSTLLQIVQAPPPRLRSVRPDVPPGLEQVVAAALTMDPNQRIGTALELRKRLIEAWRSEADLSEIGEVGDFVREVAKSKLEKRRLQAAQVIKLRAKMASVSRSALTAAAESGTPSIPAPQPDEPSGLSTAGVTSPSEIAALHSAPPVAPRPAPPRQRGGWALLCALAAAAAGAGAWALLRAGPTDSDPAPSAAVIAPAPAVSLEPLATAAPALPAASEPEPEAAPRRLVVRANAPIAKLVIAGESLSIEKAVRQLTHDLPAAHRQGDFTVEAQAADGRRVSLAVAGDTELLELSFPRPTALAQPKPVKPSSPPKRPEPPGLAPTPYGNP
jgi:eukaryotic-like serine/threonine-protein kinase